VTVADEVQTASAQLRQHNVFSEGVKRKNKHHRNEFLETMAMLGAVFAGILVAAAIAMSKS
jgi:hypothetical protein